MNTSATELHKAFEKKDAKAATALTLPAVRARYQQIFKEHEDELERVAALLATRKLIVVTPEVAEYEVSDGGHKFRITFEKIGGKWFLSSL